MTTWLCRHRPKITSKGASLVPQTQTLASDLPRRTSVVLALAGGEQKRVCLAGGVVVAVGDDLAVVVDRGGVGEGEPGAGWDQVVEVLECAVAPDPGPVAGLADDHAVVVDRLADRVQAEGPQVGHRAVAPQEHVGGFAGGVRPAGDLA